jgi:hypothetical protein
MPLDGKFGIEKGESIMANPYAIFKTNEGMEQSGIFLDYGDFRVKIARAGGANKRFGKLLTARLKPFKRQIEMDSMDENVATGVMVETYVDSVILDIEIKDKDASTDSNPVYVQGILDPESNILPFNRENAIKFFTDLPELFKDVQAQAGQVALFRAEEQEAEIKN